MIWIKSSILLLFMTVSLNSMFMQCFQNNVRRLYEYSKPYCFNQQKTLNAKIDLYRHLLKTSKSRLSNELHTYKTVQALVDSVKTKAAVEHTIFSQIYNNAKKNNRFKKKICFVYDEPKHEKPVVCIGINKYIFNILTLYNINAQEISISYDGNDTYEGCSVFAKEVYKNSAYNNKEKHIKIMLCIDEQQCLDYGFAYLIAHEAMHIKYKDMEYVYGLNKKIKNTVLTKYLQAVELRADMATLDCSHSLIMDAFRQDVITQALCMHVQRLPSVERLKAKPTLWDTCPVESTHPTSLERFAYFARAEELL